MLTRSDRTTAKAGLTIALALGLTLGIWQQPAACQPILSESFDGPTPSWRQPEDRGATRVVSQQRVRLKATRGSQEASGGAEMVHFGCPPGYSGVFYQTVGRAPVLEEFRVSLKLLTEIPGAQLAVRVVFPRSKGQSQADLSPGAQVDESNQAGPAMTVVRGVQRYQTPGQWQQLTLSGLPKLVERQARLLRARPDFARLDSREAYVDRILLVVPGEPTGTRFWTDDLVVKGVLLDKDSETAPPDLNSLEGDTNSADQQPLYPVAVTSRGFSIGDDDLYPLVWAGSSLAPAKAKEFGFNCLVLNTPAVKDQWKAVADEKLRVVCPVAVASDADSLADEGRLPHVLGWVIPEEVDGRSLDAVRPLLDRVQADHRLACRPVIAKPRGGLAAWSRSVDVLALEAGRGRFNAQLVQARPGTPAVARISLTVSAAAQEQRRALAGEGKTHAWRDPRKVEAEVWSAVSMGAKGIWMESTDSLAAGDGAARQMAATVQLINHKLDLIEPWLTGAQASATVYDFARRPIGTIVERDQTKLVIGFSSPEQRARPVTIPGIPAAATLLGMSAGGLAPVAGERVAGGVSVSPELLEPGSFLLITSDPLSIRNINRRIAKTAKRSVALQQRLAARELAEWSDLVASPDLAANSGGAAAVTATVKRSISQSQAALSAGDATTASNRAAFSRRTLADSRRAIFRQLHLGGNHVSSPLLELPATWSDAIRLRRLARSLPRGPNLLAGGNFETLEEARSTGWRHTASSSSQSAERQLQIEFSAENPRYGEHCLVFSSAEREVAQLAEENQAWVTSPPIPLAAGQLVEVTGWVRMDRVDGERATLEISDSLGGEELAIEVTPAAESWRPFQLVRRPTKGENLRVNFAFSGVGKAAIDAVMVRQIRVSPAEGGTAEGNAADGYGSPASANSKATARRRTPPAQRK